MAGVLEQLTRPQKRVVVHCTLNPKAMVAPDSQGDPGGGLQGQALGGG